MSSDVFAMKKGKQLQKTINEGINKQRAIRQRKDSEGKDNFAEWKLFAPDAALIPSFRDYIHQGQFTSTGFAEGKYKDFFLGQVHLADNALGILTGADITNSTCNSY